MASIIEQVELLVTTIPLIKNNPAYVYALHIFADSFYLCMNPFAVPSGFEEYVMAWNTSADQPPPQQQWRFTTAEDDLPAVFDILQQLPWCKQSDAYASKFTNDVKKVLPNKYQIRASSEAKSKRDDNDVCTPAARSAILLATLFGNYRHARVRVPPSIRAKIVRHINRSGGPLAFMASHPCIMIWAMREFVTFAVDHYPALASVLYHSRDWDMFVVGTREFMCDTDIRQALCNCQAEAQLPSMFQTIERNTKRGRQKYKNNDTQLAPETAEMLIMRHVRYGRPDVFTHTPSTTKEKDGMKSNLATSIATGIINTCAPDGLRYEPLKRALDYCAFHDKLRTRQGTLNAELIYVLGGEYQDYQVMLTACAQFKNKGTICIITDALEQLTARGIYIVAQMAARQHLKSNIALVHLPHEVVVAIENALQRRCGTHIPEGDEGVVDLCPLCATFHSFCVDPLMPAPVHETVGDRKSTVDISDTRWSPFDLVPPPYLTEPGCGGPNSNTHGKAPAICANQCRQIRINLRRHALIFAGNRIQLCCNCAIPVIYYPALDHNGLYSCGQCCEPYRRTPMEVPWMGRPLVMTGSVARCFFGCRRVPQQKRKNVELQQHMIVRRESKRPPVEKICIGCTRSMKRVITRPTTMHNGDQFIVCMWCRRDAPEITAMAADPSQTLSSLKVWIEGKLESKCLPPRDATEVLHLLHRATTSNSLA